MVGDADLPESVVDAGVDAWLAQLRRQGLSDRTLERRARALGDAVRYGLPLPPDVRAFCQSGVGTVDPRGNRKA